MKTLLVLLFLSTTLCAQKSEVTVSSNQNSTSISSIENNQTNIKVVASYFEYLFKTGDFVSMQKIISKDAINSQAEGLPYGGTYIGFDGMVQMFTKAQGYFNLEIVSEPVYFTSPNKNEVIIHFTIKCKSKKSNNEITMPIAEYFEVKNGMIIGIRPFYFDTKAFADFLK
ncbi:MAG: hypothetical protein ABI663_18440 [Chryseolinea sp.]